MKQNVKFVVFETPLYINLFNITYYYYVREMSNTNEQYVDSPLNFMLYAI